MVLNSIQIEKKNSLQSVYKLEIFLRSKCEQESAFKREKIKDEI